MDGLRRREGCERENEAQKLFFDYKQAECKGLGPRQHQEQRLGDKTPPASCNMQHAGSCRGVSMARPRASNRFIPSGAWAWGLACATWGSALAPSASWGSALAPSGALALVCATSAPSGAGVCHGEETKSVK